jgi:hypothetical protein
MAKFELKKNSVALEICGTQFEVNLTNEVILACDSLKNNAAELLPKLKQSGNAAEILEETYTLLANGIDDVLGTGSVSKIFGDKAITLLDLTDIIIFIRNEINAAFQKKAQTYRSKK